MLRRTTYVLRALGVLACAALGVYVMITLGSDPEHSETVRVFLASSLIYALATAVVAALAVIRDMKGGRTPIIGRDARRRD